MSDENFDRIEALLAELDIDDLEPVALPDDLWAGIERQIVDVPDVPDVPPATVVNIESRRRSPATWVMAAAAAVALVIAGTLVVVGRGTDEPVLSTAELTFDPAAFDPRGADASAEARLLNRDGTYEIELTNTQFPQLGDDDLELWLIQPDAAGAPVDVAPVSLIDPEGDGTYRGSSRARSDHPLRRRHLDRAARRRRDPLRPVDPPRRPANQLGAAHRSTICPRRSRSFMKLIVSLMNDIR